MVAFGILYALNLFPNFESSFTIQQNFFSVVYKFIVPITGLLMIIKGFDSNGKT